MAEEEKGGLIRCANCGAEFDAALPRCPYCGRMNVPAAEDEYMDHLEDIRTDLDDLEGLAGRKARERLKISARKILLTVLVLLAAAGLILFVRIRADRAEAEASRAEYLWQRDAFARLDELYAARDWDGLEQAFREGLDADHEMYQYAHGTFCGYLMTLSDARRSLADLAAGDAEPVLALCDAAEVWKLEDLQGALKEGEADVLSALREPLVRDMAERFSLTEEEISRLRSLVDENGFLPIREAEKMINEKEMG